MRILLLPTALGLVALLPACTQPAGRGAAAETTVVVRDSVTGTVAYRERMALPPDAVLSVQLQDVSRPDVAATVVAAATVPARGRQVPLAFSLPYDTLRIDRTNTYAVQARIEAGGKVLFANDAAYPVITRGNAKQVQMLLRRVRD
ncbi:hypothetical protein GCM10027048_37770 [Hymenobacter coalescens]